MLSDCKNSAKVDLRVRKTERALIASMISLLQERQFTKLTVDRLCKEGQLSRATFYAHFTDKYALLEFLLRSFCTHKVTAANTYEDMKEFVNQFVSENKKIIKNLLIDADCQTLEIIQDFLCAVLALNKVKHIDGKISPRNIVTANLYVGGIIYYLLWQARNDFPKDVPVINEHSFEAIKRLWDWATEQ